jgi:hypothetical protein
MFQYGQNMTRTSRRNTAAVYTGDLRGVSVAPGDLDPGEVGIPHRNGEGPDGHPVQPVEFGLCRGGTGYRIVASGGRTGSISHLLDACSSRKRSRTVFSALW